MANVCDNCGKGSDFGNLVSHAKNRTKTLRKPNLHSAKVMVKGKVVRMRLCTKCLRKADRPFKMKAEAKVKSSEVKAVKEAPKKTVKKSQPVAKVAKTKKETKKKEK